MNTRKKIVLSLLINVVIVVLELIGLYLSLRRHGTKAFQFYTENSNYFTLIVSMCYCLVGVIAISQRRLIPKWIVYLRYTATTCLVITFVVVAVILIPMFPHTWKFMLFDDSNLYQHLLCPIISTLSFVLLENDMQIDKKAILLATIPTIIYGIIMIVLNILRVVTGPYPFFYVYDVPWYSCTVFIIVIGIVAITVAIGLYLLFNRGEKKEKAKLSKRQLVKD